jgi:type I restriction enzyme S subunit
MNNKKGWELVKLGDVASFVNGYAFKPTDWSNEGMEIIRIQNLTKSSSECNYFIGKIPEKYKVTKGDILISWSATLDIFQWEGSDAWLNQHIFKVVFDKMEIDKKFFIFMIMYVLDDIKKQVHGATMKHITKDKFDNIQIPLPPLPEQQRIASLLDAADALRRKDRALLQKYEELAQAVFMDMFGDPVKNEKGWEKIPFGELFDTRLGKMLDAKKQLGNIKYKYLGNSNVQWFRFQLEGLAEMEFEQKDLKTFDLKNGDILICEGGEVGRSAIWRNEKENIYFQKAIHRARAKTLNITSEYTVFMFWFYAKFGGLKDYVTTSTISHLTGEKLKTIPIPVPPLSLQMKFENLILNQRKQTEYVSSKSSNALFQTLLQKAFKGELL